MEIAIFHMEEKEEVSGMKAEDELRAYLDSQGINLEHFLEQAPDADEYFKEKAQRVSKLDTQVADGPNMTLKRGHQAGDAATTMSEKEAYAFLNDRGFGGGPITTSYSMEGAYFDPMEISDQSPTHHPTYETRFESDLGEIWTVSIIGMEITAYPLLFNLKSDREVALILAESEMVTSYDSTTKTFYKSMPKTSSLVVKRVEKVDQETLNGMTAEVMEQ